MVDRVCGLTKGWREPISAIRKWTWIPGGDRVTAIHRASNIIPRSIFVGHKSETILHRFAQIRAVVPGPTTPLVRLCRAACVTTLEEFMLRPRYLLLAFCITSTLPRAPLRSRCPITPEIYNTAPKTNNPPSPSLSLALAIRSASEKLARSSFAFRFLRVVLFDQMY